MNRVVEAPERLLRSSELTRLQMRVAALAAVMMIVGGLAALASGPVEQTLATLEQHDLAAAGDAQITRYANALGGLYDIVADDFEDALVAFEFGALPTTVEGEVLGVSAPAKPAQPVTEVLELEVDPPPPAGEAEAVSPTAPAVFGGGIIRIPAISLNQSVGEGVTREHLKLGPGHYPGTALPGEEGNVVISGHRTTYSRPFHDLDLLEPGDPIFIDTPEGTHVYTVSKTLVVSADNAEPLRDTLEARLTLTTCHPKGSARERLVVVAVYDGSPTAMIERG